MTPLNPASFLLQLQKLLPGVSRETLSAGVARLEIYAALLVKWQKAINLVGPNTLPDLWRRHMLDSAQLLPLLPPIADGADGTITDFGSGAGFPGLVLAAFTDRPVQLIDSDVRKCAFFQNTTPFHRWLDHTRRQRSDFFNNAFKRHVDVERVTHRG